MIKRIISRIIQFILVIVSVSFFTFSLIYLAPGDAAELVLSLQGEGASKEVIEEMRDSMGLNDPFFVQYGRWVKNALHGDLGVSYKNGHLVKDEISGKFQNTLLLAAAAFVVLIIFAFPLGIVSALYHNKFIDKSIRVFTIFGVSMPQFWLALMLLFILSVRLRLLPVSPSITLKGMVMPVIALAFDLICTYARQIRAAILEEMGQQYVTGLRARGVPKRTILFRNVIPNSMTSIITLLGLSAGTLLSGTVVIEQILGWPGIGKFTLEAISYRDYPVIQAYVLVITLAYIMINLLVDIIVYFQNPRARAGKLSK
ncbi:MAG: ABC transporter permease [Oscillospiraceae bacterium]|nr:ABC transporter permease [Oscillospiraceae bacterium]